MVLESRLGYPAWSYPESVLRCWSQLGARSQCLGRRGKALPWPQSSSSWQAALRTWGKDLPVQQTYLHPLRPSQAGDSTQPEPDYYGSIPFNIDGSVWRSIRASQQTLQKTQTYLAPTTSSLAAVFFPGLILGGRAEASWKG